ncbi:hypothetical protein Ccrd_010595 [Cynara cardunculus var. scolymus]|uniref:Arginine and glutamate-rich protein 1 n=1 Tax=Cynara cardunculus var. scolymus TaxID=59895 RepID=A0A103YKW2_CYNCS|nr:hypothetical protein Ccrd_010595 [Cynara cardunculus var. scolymus]
MVSLSRAFCLPFDNCATELESIAAACKSLLRSANRIHRLFLNLGSNAWCWRTLGTDLTDHRKKEECLEIGNYLGRRPIKGVGIQGHRRRLDTGIKAAEIEVEEIEAANLLILIADILEDDSIVKLCTPGRRSRSISPRRHRRRSRSPTPRRRRSRSSTPRRHKRQKSRSSSLSPIAKSPGIGSIECKIVGENLKKEEEDERKRRQHEAELKLMEEETAKRVEEAIRKKVEERLGSEEIRLEIQRQLEEGRKKVLSDVVAQLEKEKEAAEQARREKEELERLVEQNRKRIEEAQRREAMEQQRREEERYRELEELQRQKEEALRRKKQQEEEERAKQQKLLGKNKSRPKLSFALGSK